MNNFDRIQQELAKEATRFALEAGMDAQQFLDVVLEIVNAEDEHRISKTNIRQQVRTIVSNAAVHGRAEEE